MSDLASRLRELRKEKGFTQKQMAAEFGLTWRSWQDYEAAKRSPAYSGLNKIADYFKVSTDYLLGRSDDRLTEEEAEMMVIVEDINDPLHQYETEYRDLVLKIIILAQNINRMNYNKKKSDEFLSSLETFVREISLEGALPGSEGQFLSRISDLLKDISNYFNLDPMFVETHWSLLVNFVNETLPLANEGFMGKRELLSRIADIIKDYVDLGEKTGRGHDFITIILSEVSHELKRLE